MKNLIKFLSTKVKIILYSYNLLFFSLYLSKFFNRYEKISAPSPLIKVLLVQNRKIVVTRNKMQH